MKRHQNEEKDKPLKQVEFLTSFCGFDSGQYANELFKEIRASRRFRYEDLKLVLLMKE